MDEEKKKVVMIAIIVICLVLAAAIFAFTRPDTGNTGPVQMLCEECGHEYSLGREEFKKQLLATGSIGPMVTEPIPLVCPQCGEETAFCAKTCPECKKIFLPDPMSGDFQDRCPDCGFSAIEERVGKRNR